MLPLPQCEEPSVTEPGTHQPVLLQETLEWLAPKPGDVVVDATVGLGGHAELLLEAVGTTGRVLGIDRDAAALAAAERRLSRFGDAFVAVRGNHEELARLLEHAGVEGFDRILFDLGLSSVQLDDAARGFSIRADGPLDMRMDPSKGRTAADLLAELSEEDLRRILWRFGEEKQSRRIAQEIVRRRKSYPLVRTHQLSELVERVAGPQARRFRIHPATRTFQALRIAVNEELVGLEALIENAVELLRPGGRLAVISFHSLEDRPVKHTLRGLAHRCTCPPRLPVCGCGLHDLVRVLTSKPVRPSTTEVDRNPRARSAKLRVAERL